MNQQVISTTDSHKYLMKKQVLGVLLTSYYIISSVNGID